MSRLTLCTLQLQKYKTLGKLKEIRPSKKKTLDIFGYILDYNNTMLVSIVVRFLRLNNLLKKYIYIYRELLNRTNS